MDYRKEYVDQVAGWCDFDRAVDYAESLFPSQKGGVEAFAIKPSLAYSELAKDSEASFDTTAIRAARHHLSGSPNLGRPSITIGPTFDGNHISYHAIVHVHVYVFRILQTSRVLAISGPIRKIPPGSIRMLARSTTCATKSSISA